MRIRKKCTENGHKLRNFETQQHFAACHRWFCQFAELYIDGRTYVKNDNGQVVPKSEWVRSRG